MNLLLIYECRLVREGLRAILQQDSNIRIVSELDGLTAQDTVYPAWHMDVAVISYALYQQLHTEVAACSSHWLMRVPIVMVGVSEQAVRLRPLLQSCIQGYLSLQASADQLIHAVYRVAKGDRYISPDLAERLAFEQISSHGASPLHSLTDRECQVLHYLLQGYTLTQIAKVLSIHEKTVSTYKTRLMRKLGVRSNLDLHAFAVGAGIAIGRQENT